MIGPSDHALDDLVERKGLFELHMHLNGSTELDVLWPYACRDPDAFYKELADAWYENREPTAELYEQMEPGLTPLALYRRLRAVRRVRRQIAAEIACRIGASRQDPPIAWGIQGLLRAMEVDRSDLAWRAPLGASLRTHPGRVIHPGGPPHASIIEEAAFLYSCLLALVQAPDSVVGTGLYYNLLVLNQIGRIVVQQADETGFDQFQKYTFVGVRSGIERRYDMRFRQLNGRAPFDTLSHLEGRFAPKGTVLRPAAHQHNRWRLPRIPRLQAQEPDLSGPPPPCLLGLPCPEVGPRIGRRLPEGCRGHGRPGTELSLVAHFIKKPPKAALDRARGCRDSELRLSLLMQARALRRLLQGNQIACALVRGVDAASNELHAPPEPFAPAFRLARAAGIPRATFHVGEDFRHLVSGIRAVAEALTFLDLRSGDRIGHATALGITPNLWAARTAERTYLTVIDALDDAVFVHRRLAERGGYEREVLKLGDRIATLSGMLYGEPRSPALLHRAWELRRLDALEMRAAERAVSRSGRPLTAAAIADEAKRLATTTLDRQRASELALIAEEVAAAGCAYTIYAMRQRLGREAWQAKVEVEAELVSAEALVVLQDSVLGDVNRRGVAIERCPRAIPESAFIKRSESITSSGGLALRDHRSPIVRRSSSAATIPASSPRICATNMRRSLLSCGTVSRCRRQKRFAASRHSATVPESSASGRKTEHDRWPSGSSA